MSEINDLMSEINKLRLELKVLRFKESQEQRFIWWVWNVYSKNVMDTALGIIQACTYQDEPTAEAGKYGLPKKCFENLDRLIEYSHGINDGTYFDTEASMEKQTCQWMQADDDSNTWAGECGIEFNLETDTPEANGMIYCPKCGKMIDNVEG